MFQRRTRQHWTQQLREMLWPSMGWKRACVYVGHRLVRLKDSNYSICCGLALGTGISFVPLPGSHIIQAALFAWAMRANIVASFIGTLVGNPWTLPLMWWSSYELGGWLFRLFGFPVRGMPAEFTWHNLLVEIEQDPFGLLLPWVVGGYGMLIIGGILSYWIFYWLLIQARARRISWKEARMHRDSIAMTEPNS